MPMQTRRKSKADAETRLSFKVDSAAPSMPIPLEKRAFSVKNYPRTITNLFVSRKLSSARPPKPKRNRQDLLLCEEQDDKPANNHPADASLYCCQSGPTTSVYRRGISLPRSPKKKKEKNDDDLSCRSCTNSNKVPRSNLREIIATKINDKRHCTRPSPPKIHHFTSTKQTIPRTELWLPEEGKIPKSWRTRRKASIKPSRVLFRLTNFGHGLGETTPRQQTSTTNTTASRTRISNSSSSSTVLPIATKEEIANVLLYCSPYLRASSSVAIMFETPLSASSPLTTQSILPPSSHPAVPSSPLPSSATVSAHVSRYGNRLTEVLTPGVFRGNVCFLWNNTKSYLKEEERCREPASTAVSTSSPIIDTASTTSCSSPREEESRLLRFPSRGDVGLSPSSITSSSHPSFSASSPPSSSVLLSPVVDVAKVIKSTGKVPRRTLERLRRRGGVRRIRYLLYRGEGGFLSSFNDLWSTSACRRCAKAATTTTTFAAGNKSTSVVPLSESTSAPTLPFPLPAPTRSASTSAVESRRRVSFRHLF